MITRTSDHKYILDSVEYPSVTTILNGIFPIWNSTSNMMQEAAKFGSDVHTACELWDNNNLDLATVNNDILEYLNGWIRFREELPGKIFKNELVVYSAKFKFAGTLDRIMEFKSGLAVVDLKTSTIVSSTVGLQTAAYQMAAEEMLGIKIKKRMAVQLLPNSYKLITLNGAMDKQVFISALSCYNWKKQN